MRGNEAKADRCNATERHKEGNWAGGRRNQKAPNGQCPKPDQQYRPRALFVDKPPSERGNHRHDQKRDRRST